MFTIEDVIETLNKIEVKGKDNLDRLLGAILALEFVIKARDEEEKEKNACVGAEDEGGEVDGG